MTIKTFNIKKSDYNSLNVPWNFKGLDFIDKKKLLYYNDEFTRGVKNYLLFQKFPFFKYPLWLDSVINKDVPSYSPVPHLYLSNGYNRNCINFSNLLSKEYIRIDQSGMISPSGEEWSIEFWIINNEHTMRPQERVKSIVQTRDINTSIVKTIWEEDEFLFKEEIYGAMTDINEVIIELTCSLKRKNNPIELLVLCRPYNDMSIGGIQSIEFKKDTRIISINGKNRVLMKNPPDFLSSGNSQEGDIKINIKNKNELKSICPLNMATLALGYKFKESENKVIIRLALTRKKSISPIALNYDKLKNDFIDFTRVRNKKSCSINISDNQFQNWFEALKISLLNSANPEKYLKNVEANKEFNVKYIYYITKTYNRMGFFPESARLIDAFIDNYELGHHKSFLQIIKACYILCALSDYFTISRDMEYLQEKFSKIKNIAGEIFAKAKEINFKKDAFRDKDNVNSIKDYYISGLHLHDIILVSFSMHQYSYLSRCLGLFGEEIKFNKGAGRLDLMIAEQLPKKKKINKSKGKKKKDEKAVEETDIIEMPKKLEPDDEFFFYNLFAGYPFNLPCVEQDIWRFLCEYIPEYLKGTPVYVKSYGGCNSFFSLIYAINLLHVKNEKAVEILNIFMDYGKGRYSIPEVLNPVNGLAVFGEGDSSLAQSLMFNLLRYLLFIDHENRLELFPLPREHWFEIGKEIVVNNAPSRFGYINYRVVTTSNEIQIFLNDLPQYLPPEILINLPFKTKIKKEDDFLIKKEIGNSYLISGWPAIIKFSK